MPKTGTFKRKMANFWKQLGPGLITGSSDDDPSGIATYSQAGAQFGLATLWTALITFPLMASIQETCARIGMVTSRGLTGTLKQHYPKAILYTMLLFSFPAIVMNIGADIAGMGAVGNLLFPTISAGYFSIFFYNCPPRANCIFPLSENRKSTQIPLCVPTGLPGCAFYGGPGLGKNPARHFCS